MGKYRNVDKELIELAALRKTGKQISSILNMDYSTVHKKLRRLGISLPNYHNQLKFDNTVFDTIDTEEKAYWLGFLYADGYVSSNKNVVELSLKASDKDHIEKFRKFLKCTEELTVKVMKSTCKGKEFERARLCLYNNHFWESLVKLGCVPNKSLVLQFPSLSIFSKEDLVIPFIRGYIDGDGCLYSTRTGRLAIQVIGTSEFLDGILEIFPQLNSKKKKDSRHPTSNTYYISCTCNKADSIANILYNNAIVYLDRKYERYKRFAVPIEKSLELLGNNIGEGCDANTEITKEIKESLVS